MNQDIIRSFLLRLLVITTIVVAARFALVLPRTQHLKEMRKMFDVQTRQVEDGEKAIGLYSGKIAGTVELMREVRDEIAQELALCESTQIHKRLQQAAEQNMLTVARIEPLRTSSDRGASDLVPDAIELETQEFRIECMGPYSGIIGYIDELESGPNMVKVTAFRMVPTSGDTARVTMQVALHQLVKTPEAFSGSFTEPTMQISTAGGIDADS